MTVPVPPFGGSSALENYPLQPVAPGGPIPGILYSSGPAPGIPVVIQLLEKIVLFPLSAYGIAGDDAVWFNVAVAQMQKSPICGKLRMAAGQYTLNSQVSFPGEKYILEGQGALTVLNTSVNGQAFYFHGSSPLPFAEGIGSHLRDFIIDGTNVPNNAIGSVGIDVGDADDINFWNVVIRNFTTLGATSGTPGAPGNYAPNGAVGLNINNTLTQTEKLHGYIKIVNCQNCVQYITTGTVSGGASQTTSHMYGKIYYHIDAQQNQNGIVIARQGHLMNGEITVTGNLHNTSVGPNTGAAFVVGTQNQAGHIRRVRMHVYLEANPGTGGGGVPHQTINFGSNADNTLQECDGHMQFLNGWALSNGGLSQGAGNYNFAGTLVGDANLGAPSNPQQTGLPAMVAGAPMCFSPISALGAAGVIPLDPSGGNFVKFTLSQNSTVSMAIIGGANVATFMLVVISQPATGGGLFTVTWPDPGSPTVGAPAVKFAGGSAPVQSTGNGATDVYLLFTLDGITWYGFRLAANVS